MRLDHVGRGHASTDADHPDSSPSMGRRGRRVARGGRHDRRRSPARVGGTTAVFGTDHHALYFSKEVVPYIDPGKEDQAFAEVFHHVGLYAYRPTALAQYVTWAPGRLEKLEGLEQLRFLEHGIPVLCVEVEGRGRVFWELNNPADVPRIEKVLKAAS